MKALRYERNPVLRPVLRNLLAAAPFLALAPVLPARADVLDRRQPAPGAAVEAAAALALEARLAAAMAPPARRVLEVMERNGTQTLPLEAHVLLYRYGAWLELLPLADLQHVRLHQDGFELAFDFGGKKCRQVEIPGRELLVLEGKDPARARIRRVTAEGRTLAVARKVRFFTSHGEIAGVREGDLEAKWGMFWPDLELRTFHAPGRIARDEDGRLCVRADENGRPLYEDGRPVLETYDRWVVVEVSGHAFEIGVPAPDDARELEAMLARR